METDLRAAARQALEVLEVLAENAEDDCGEETCPDCKAWRPVWATITVLRAALEQPEQEPVATVAMDVSRPHLYYGWEYLGQKPDSKMAMLLKGLPVGTMLYTHPPRREWRGLTEEEIIDGREQLPTEDLCNWSFRKGVEFAEAALKERNA